MKFFVSNIGEKGVIGDISNIWFGIDSLARVVQMFGMRLIINFALI